jgi:perosamine synthetase
MIPLSIPYLKGNEIKYVTDALQNGWVSTAGSYVTKFEKNMMAYLNIEGAAACQSGTAALHLALRLAGVLEQDEVIVPTLTFIAAVNPVRYLGAQPIFMDCDETLNIDCDKVEAFLKDHCTVTPEGLVNKLTKRLIKAVVVVHVFGNMADVERLYDLTQKYGIKLIEDATEALGTRYTKGRYVGRYAGTIGDFGAYSFNGNKIITTGGGGMLVARDAKLLDEGKYLSEQAKDNHLYYVHNQIGYNYRMTNLQGAVGVAQLEVLENFIVAKIKNYHFYEESIKKISGLELIKYNPNARNNHWFYALYIQRNTLTRDVLLEKLKENQIETRPIWQLIHTQKMYAKNQAYCIEKAPHYVKHILNIPCSVNLTIEEIGYITGVLEQV